MRLVLKSEKLCEDVAVRRLSGRRRRQQDELDGTDETRVSMRHCGVVGGMHGDEHELDMTCWTESTKARCCG